MATRKEITHLEKQLGGPSLQWVLAGVPVVALFNNSEHLGEPFGHNQESDCLLLWVGLNEKSGTILFTLTHRFALSRRGRLLFLVIPCETLAFKVDAPTFWTISEDKIPSTIIDEPTDGCSEDCSLLRMHLHHNDPTARSRVIMPSVPIASEVPARAMNLLRKFRTLSEASHFELFTNHDNVVADSLQRVQMLLEQRRVCVTTPSINLIGLYPGARDAGYDLWKEQGWCEDGDMGKVTLKDSSDAQSAPLDPPPPYPEASHSPYSSHLLSSMSPLSVAAEEPAPPESVHEAALSYTSSKKRPASEILHPSRRSLSFQASKRVQHGPREGDEEEEEEEEEEEANQIFPASSHISKSSRPLVQHERVENNLNLPSTEEESKYISHEENIEVCPEDITHNNSQGSETHSRSFRLATESPECVEIEVPCSLGDDACSATPLTPRPRLFESSETTLSVKARLASPILLFAETPIAADVPVSVEAPIAVHLPVNAERPTSVNILRPQCPLPAANGVLQEASPQHHLQIPAWLTNAWSLCPYAHYLFVTEILNLGVASLDPDPYKFNACRANANTVLLSHWAKHLHSGSSISCPCPHSTRRQQIETDMSALFQWLSILDGQADLKLLSNMKAVASAREVFLTCDDGANEDKHYEAYMMAKAWFVTKACRLFGADVLARDGEKQKKIASRMVQEMRRVVFFSSVSMKKI